MISKKIKEWKILGLGVLWRNEGTIPKEGRPGDCDDSVVKAA